MGKDVKLNIELEKVGLKKNDLLVVTAETAGAQDIEELTKQLDKCLTDENAAIVLNFPIKIEMIDTTTKIIVETLEEKQEINEIIQKQQRMIQNNKPVKNKKARYCFISKKYWDVDKLPFRTQLLKKES